jgi:hypothetical protein
MPHPSTSGINYEANRWLPLFLAVLLALPSTAAGQSQTPVAAAGPSSTTQSLKVIPLAGNEEMNDLQRRIMAPLVVQVLDQDSRPVEGADVTFRFPVMGPSALFSDQKNSATVRTNADGQASAVGWIANGMTGRFQLQVTASRGNELGTAVLFMTNVTTISAETRKKPKSVWSSKWTKIAIVAGAAAIVVGVVLATRGGSSTSTATAPITITGVPGFPTIGGTQ